MLKKIRIWWKYSGQYLLTDFVYGVKNLIKWFPIVWKDRDWDYSYILRVLKFKLENQASNTENFGYHVDSERDVKQMRVCAKLIELINDGFYEVEYMDYYKDEFWFEDIPNSDGKELKRRGKTENFNEYFDKYPLIYMRVMRGEGPFEFKDTNDKRLIAMNIAYINHERAKRLLFKIMNENIEVWWN